MMDDLIYHTSWMSDIPDDAPMTTLNIPGTHNSCCVKGPLGVAETQNLDLPDQLNAGIRFLDIRLTHYHDNLCVHHDAICTERSYSDVLTVCTFSSAVDLTAGGYARTINPRLNDYLIESTQGRIGIIVMDYFDEPRESISNVIETNFHDWSDRRSRRWVPQP